MQESEHSPQLDRRQILKYGAALGLGVALGSVATEGIRRELEAKESQPHPLSPEAENTGDTVSIAWLPRTVKRWAPTIEKYSSQYEIDPNLPAIIMTIESGGDPFADSGVARGLMQITDPRAIDIAAKFLQEPRNDYDLLDPETNIEFGVANIRQLINTFGTSDQGPSWDETVGLVGAGYYAGEGGAMKYRDAGLTGIEDQGTYNYIRYVTTMWRERYDNKSFAFRYWHDQGNGQALIAAAKRYKFRQN